MDYKVSPHPATGLPVLDMPHGQFGLGCLPKHVSANADLYPPVGATYPDVPQTAWTEQDFDSFDVPVLDQGRSSACGPHALVEAMAVAFAMSSDEKPVLSPWFVYGVLNRGRDDGTALPDLLKVAQQTGAPLDSSVKRGDFSGRYAQAVYDQAARFRIEAAYDSPTLANLCSSAERRQPAVIGIDIGINFKPDAGGFLPPYQQGPQILGHAISVVGKKFAQGVWWLKIRNHWTAQWGTGGCGYLHPSYVNPYFGAWTLRTAALDPQFPGNPPAAS